jgi:hypothetical protein
MSWTLAKDDPFVADALEGINLIWPGSIEFRFLAERIKPSNVNEDVGYSNLTNPRLQPACLMFDFMPMTQ